MSASTAYCWIQDKYSICPKRTSYFGNISWFDSSTSMTVQSINSDWLTQIIMFATPLWYIALFYKFLFRYGGFENTWWYQKQKFRDVLLFLISRKLQTYYHRIVKSTERILKIFLEMFTPMDICFIFLRIHLFAKK